jgi:hypothetical protein
MHRKGCTAGRAHLPLQGVEGDGDDGDQQRHGRRQHQRARPGRQRHLVRPAGRCALMKHMIARHAQEHTRVWTPLLRQRLAGKRQCPASQLFGLLQCTVTSQSSALGTVGRWTQRGSSDERIHPASKLRVQSAPGEAGQLDAQVDEGGELHQLRQAVDDVLQSQADSTS